MAPRHPGHASLIASHAQSRPPAVVSEVDWLYYGGDPGGINDTQGPLECACHEGNNTLRNILSAARAEEEGRDSPVTGHETLPK